MPGAAMPRLVHTVPPHTHAHSHNTGCHVCHKLQLILVLLSETQLQRALFKCLPSALVVVSAII